MSEHTPSPNRQSKLLVLDHNVQMHYLCMSSINMYLPVARIWNHRIMSGATGLRFFACIYCLFVITSSLSTLDHQHLPCLHLIQDPRDSQVSDHPTAPDASDNHNHLPLVSPECEIIHPHSSKRQTRLGELHHALSYDPRVFERSLSTNQTLRLPAPGLSLTRTT